MQLYFIYKSLIPTCAQTLSHHHTFSLSINSLTCSASLIGQ